MSRLRADLPNFSGMPTGSFVIKNTRQVPTNFLLEYDDGSFHTIAADWYDVDAFSGYIVQREKDDSGATVDMSAILAYPFYWSGYAVSTTAGLTPVTREQVEWYQETNPEPQIDAVGRVNLNLAYNEFFANMFAASLRILVGANIDSISFVSLPFDISRNAIINVSGVGGGVTGLNLQSNPDALTPTGQVALSALNGSTNEVVMGVVSTPDELYAYVAGDNVLGLHVGDSPIAPDISDGAGIDVEGKIIRVRTNKTPANTADTGNAGEWCADNDYFYKYTNVGWKRAALSTF